MTVTIALQVHDGVVLASDSAITLTDPTKSAPDNIVNVYGHGNKIFNLVKGLPIGGAFYGMASIGPSSISTLIKDLRKLFTGEEKNIQGFKLNNKSYTIESVSIKVRDFLCDHHFMKLNPVPANAGFGFYVVGYGSGSALSEVWSFQISGQTFTKPTCAIAQGASNCTVGGEPDVFNRIANGFSLALGPNLIAAGIDAAIVGQVMAEANKLALPLVEPAMPMQDAIALAEFFISTTAQIASFKRGFATVGGAIESAAITKHEGFRWVRRKHYFSKELNPGA